MNSWGVFLCGCSRADPSLCKGNVSGLQGKAKGGLGREVPPRERDDPAPLAHVQGLHLEISASQNPCSSCTGSQPMRLL